jgi:hypothetical protein
MEDGITMAALAALLTGDEENAQIAMIPGGIELQEAAGQQEFVANDTLPIDCGWNSSPDQFRVMGIIYGDQVDDLFVEVQLPDGWKKVEHGSRAENKEKRC